jgi:hypothetical protein
MRHIVTIQYFKVIVSPQSDVLSGRLVAMGGSGVKTPGLSAFCPIGTIAPGGRVPLLQPSGRRIAQKTAKSMLTWPPPDRHAVRISLEA